MRREATGCGRGATRRSLVAALTPRRESGEHSNSARIGVPDAYRVMSLRLSM